MAPLAAPDQNNMSALLHQSAPVDVAAPYSPSTLRGKTILLTGGASGLGAAFARHWAAHGAHLIIGDINDDAGVELVAELRAASASASASTNNDDSDQKQQQQQHHHFIHVDVTSWASQASLFQEAVRLSPTGELDAVVASAGISDKAGAITGKGFENPVGLDQPNPPAPHLKCIEVNLIGMMYTAHLALFWLAQNNPNPNTNTNTNTSANAHFQDTRDARDRHLLMIGSSAGLSSLPGVPEYVTSKHGVTGLFRSLRTLSYRHGIRVNLLCPYFVDTPILPSRAVAMCAGLGLGRLDDTVDAATRFMAATITTSTTTSTTTTASSPQRIAGRALVVGPRASFFRNVLPDHELEDGSGESEGEPNTDGAAVVVDKDVALGRGQAVWECYAHDYDTVDFFIRRYVRVLNTITLVKGWVAFWTDLLHALFVRKEVKPARERN